MEILSVKNNRVKFVFGLDLPWGEATVESSAKVTLVVSGKLLKEVFSIESLDDFHKGLKNFLSDKELSHIRISINRLLSNADVSS